jgi:hypothetical protein
MNIKQFGALLVLLLVHTPWSAAGERQQMLAQHVDAIVRVVDVTTSGYTTEKCASMKSLVEASVERYRDPVCGGVGSYSAECDNVEFLKKRTGADGYWADFVNKEVGVYLMHGGDITVMPDLVYAGCIKKIGESNVTKLK